MPEREMQMPPKIWTKTPCRHFGGRVHELAILQDAVRELPKPISLISGAPGAGKTSLLHEFMRRIEADVTVLEVLPAHLDNAGSLLGALLEAALRRQRFGTRVKKIAVQAIAGAVDKMLSAIVAEKTGMALELTVAQTAVESYLPSVERQAESIGKFLGQGFPAGYVIVVDEAQKLVRSQQSKFTDVFLHAMQNNAAHEGGGPLGRGWMLLCGLNDTRNVIADFDLTRPEIIANVAAIEPAAAADVLIQHLHDAGCDHATEQQIIREWIPSLVEEFHVWGHHLEGAGRCLAKLAKAGATGPDGLRQVQGAARTHQQQLYEELVMRAMHRGLSKLVIAVARYAELQKNLISEDALWAIIDFVQPAIDKVALGRNRTGTEVRRELLHVGVLQGYEQLPDGTKGWPHFRIPIPSLLNHLTSGVGVTREVEQRLQEIRTTVDQQMSDAIANGGAVARS